MSSAPFDKQEASYIGFHQAPPSFTTQDENKKIPKDFRDDLNLPNVPDSRLDMGNESTDYNDLNSRFEKLKKI